MNLRALRAEHVGRARSARISTRGASSHPAKLSKTAPAERKVMKEVHSVEKMLRPKHAGKPPFN